MATTENCAAGAAGGYGAELSKGHANMSPEQIREHACLMADIIGSQEAMIISLFQAAADRQVLTAAVTDGARSLSVVLRQVSSLFALGANNDARTLLEKAAADCGPFLTIKVPDGPDSSQFKPVAEFWPDWLNPQGLGHGD